MQHKPKEWNIYVHNAPTITHNSLLESTRSWDRNSPQAATRILTQTIILTHISSKTPNRVDYQNAHYARRGAVIIRYSGKFRYPTTWRLSWTYLASQGRILLDPYTLMTHNHACTLFDVTYVLYRSYHKAVNYRILKTAIWTPYSQHRVDGWKEGRTAWLLENLA